MNEAIKKGLKDYQSKMLIGARADGAYLPPEDGVNEKILLRDFHTITATAYPGRVWKGPFSYDFSTFNAWVNWGVEHDLPVMMHLLSGPSNYYPAWMKAAKWEGPDLQFIYYQYLRQLMTENDNGKKVSVWNVTNELLNEHDGHYRTGDDSFLTYMGWEKDESGLTGEDKVNDYHPKALSFMYETAAKFTDGKLEIREFNFEFVPDASKTKGMIQQIRHLQNKGVKIDAVGFQTHILWEPTIDYSRYDEFQRNVEQFHKLGLEVYVTELDNPNDGGEEAQCKRWEDFYRACLASGVEQVHLWGVADGVDYAWRDGTLPLLFDGNFDEKKAYFAVAKALGAED